MHGAFDITVPIPDGTAADPDSDDPVTRIELLRGHVLDVHGEPTSPKFTIDVGRGEIVEGTVRIEPVRTSDHVELMVTNVSGSALVAEVAEAIADGDDLAVYYETGHTINGGRLARKRFDIPPFTSIEFEDFSQ